MKARRELRRWIARLRARHGKPNGVIPGALLDNPRFERMAARAARERKHLRQERPSET